MIFNFPAGVNIFYAKRSRASVHDERLRPAKQTLPLLYFLQVVVIGLHSIDICNHVRGICTAR